MTKLFIYLSLPIETQFCSSVQVNKESSASESKLLLKTENKYSEADLQEVIILLIREVLASLEKDLQPSVLTLEWKLVDKWVIRLERERNDAVLSTEAFCRGPQYDLIHFTVKDSIKIDTNRHQERNFDDKEGKLKIGRAKHRCTVDGRSDALNKARPEAGGRVGKEKGINSLKLLLWIEENNLPGRSAQNQASKLHILQVPPLLLPLLFRLPLLNRYRVSFQNRALRSMPHATGDSFSAFLSRVAVHPIQFQVSSVRLYVLLKSNLPPVTLPRCKCDGGHSFN